jgi:hypothetical protein
MRAAFYSIGLASTLMLVAPATAHAFGPPQCTVGTTIPFPFQTT